MYNFFTRTRIAGGFLLRKDSLASQPHRKLSRLKSKAKKIPEAKNASGIKITIYVAEIISWRTEVRDGQPSSLVKHLYGAFFLDITGFFAFSVVGCPIP